MFFTCDSSKAKYTNSYLCGVDINASYNNIRAPPAPFAKKKFNFFQHRNGQICSLLKALQ